jgi:hypothetical protein
MWVLLLELAILLQGLVLVPLSAAEQCFFLLQLSLENLALPARMLLLMEGFLLFALLVLEIPPRLSLALPEFPGRWIVLLRRIDRSRRASKHQDCRGNSNEPAHSKPPLHFVTAVRHGAVA